MTKCNINGNEKVANETSTDEQSEIMPTINKLSIQFNNFIVQTQSEFHEQEENLVVLLYQYSCGGVYQNCGYSSY